MVPDCKQINYKRKKARSQKQNDFSSTFLSSGQGIIRYAWSGTPEWK